MKLEAAIFDLDGTLLDSMPIWQGLGEKYLLQKNLYKKSSIFIPFCVNFVLITSYILSFFKWLKKSVFLLKIVDKSPIFI